MARPKGSGSYTAKQKMAVDAIISGKAKSKMGAMRIAGYSKSSTNDAVTRLFNGGGIKKYLAELDRKSREKFGLTIQDKVMETYLNGLDATKLYGKKAKEHPDHLARIAYADRFSKFFGWEKTGIEDKANEYNQFNFFQVKPEDQKKFHTNLKEFINKQSGQS